MGMVDGQGMGGRGRRGAVGGKDVEKVDYRYNLLLSPNFQFSSLSAVTILTKLPNSAELSLSRCVVSLPSVCVCVCLSLSWSFTGDLNG